MTVSKNKKKSIKKVELEVKEQEVSQIVTDELYGKIKMGKRTPLHAQRNTGIKTRPGYTRRLVNEFPGRIESFLEAGWTPVTDKEQDERDNRLQNVKSLGTTYRPVVNRMYNAPCQHALWMEIPTEFYDEDQVYKKTKNDEVEDSYNPNRVRERDPKTYYTSHFEVKS